MSIDERLDLLHNIEQGASLSALLDVKASDIDALARMGAACLSSGQTARAMQVFSGLQALEPSATSHAFHLAVCQHRHGDAAAARATLDRLLDRHATFAERNDALLLRAELRAATDRAGALVDLAAARAAGAV
jgi:predicted TPR repeat methyltransferase